MNRGRQDIGRPVTETLTRAMPGGIVDFVSIVYFLRYDCDQAYDRKIDGQIEGIYGDTGP